MRMLLSIACCAALLSGASSQTFKQHQIGETAQHFFSIAMMTGTGSLTTKYCSEYLNDPMVLRAYEKSERNILDTKAHIRSFDVEGCKDVQAALDGKEIKIGARFASEFGSGSITFHDSKLVVMVFAVKASLDDVVTDVSKELGGVEPEKSSEMLQNGFGATLQQRKATWHKSNLIASASELRDFKYGDLGVTVVIADNDYFTKKETERQAMRPNTIQ